ncbi:hypothetical protein [Paenibacillus sp.]|uniref:hypothetical protein n=1 Tax=Paenibacillus sp. TaxID=58172 RepID=UPI002D3E5362|nr:hypothetical protein [Paenibacillus sp.]HZG57672.1 hypothetical protein [Paenibacillus sp.]
MASIDGRERPGASERTAAAMASDDREATEANLAMERVFNGRTDAETPAEAVDVPEMFRNES